MLTRDVLRRTGVTFRQLDYWCRMGYIPGQPTTVGTGYSRTFTDAQTQHVARLKKLVDAGLRPCDVVDALTSALQTPGGIVATLSPHVRVTVTDRTA